MRQRPRSSERSSLSSQGGVGAAAGWSGMLEKLWSGEDVTDDEEAEAEAEAEASSWTMSLASLLIRPSSPAGNFYEASRSKTWRFGAVSCGFIRRKWYG